MKKEEEVKEEEEKKKEKDNDNDYRAFQLKWQIKDVHLHSLLKFHWNNGIKDMSPEEVKNVKRNKNSKV